MLELKVWGWGADTRWWRGSSPRVAGTIVEVWRCVLLFFFFFGHAALAYAILVPRPGCGVLTTEPSGKFPRVAFWYDGSIACRGQGTQRSGAKLAEKDADASNCFALHLLSLRMIYGSSEWHDCDRVLENCPVVWGCEGGLEAGRGGGWEGKNRCGFGHINLPTRIRLLVSWSVFLLHHLNDQFLQFFRPAAQLIQSHC